MKNIVVWDFNNLSARCYFALKPLSDESDEPDINQYKFNVIDNIIKSVSEYNPNEVIISVDSYKSWRKLYWEKYKAHRKKTRDKSKISWEKFHIHQQHLVDELKRNFPFKVIQIDNCESDDIIGIIVSKIPNNYTIISVDEDFIQLLKYDYVKIYNPHYTKRCFISHDNPIEFVIKKSLMGQAKDNIYNVKTPLDWDDSLNKRKPSLGEKTAEKIIKEGYEDWLKSNNLVERFNFNRNLIDFDKIPMSVANVILKVYNNYKINDGNISNIYKYFKNNNFNSYLEDIHYLENMLIKLN